MKEGESSALGGKRDVGMGDGWKRGRRRGLRSDGERIRGGSCCQEGDCSR